MIPYLQTIGITRDDVQQVVTYLGNQVHKNHRLHQIIGPAPFGMQPVEDVVTEIISRGDQFNSNTLHRPREVYGLWAVLAMPPGTFGAPAEREQLSHVGAKHLAPDAAGMWAIHANPHSGACDLNWFFSAFRFAPLLMPRRNRCLHEEASFRRVLNSTIQSINGSKASGTDYLPLLRPPLPNRVETKVAAAAAERRLPVLESTLPILLNVAGVPYRIHAGEIHIFTDGSREEIRFSVPRPSFLAETRRLLAQREGEYRRDAHSLTVRPTSQTTRECTLLSEWLERATPPSTARDTARDTGPSL